MQQCPFNPLLPEHLAEPWELMAQSRREAPVAEVFPGLVYVASHELASAVFRDTAVYSSEWLPVGGVFGSGENPEEEMPFGMMDPPRHDPFRRLAVEALNVRAVRAARPWIEAYCDSLVEGFAGRGSADLVAELATPLPVAGITHMLGLGAERIADIDRWTTGIAEQFELASGFAGTEGRAGAEAEMAEFHAFLAAEIADRRAAPEVGDDILSRMVAYVEPDGRRFTDTEIRTQAQFLLMAGHETTRGLIANAMHAIATDPDLFAELRADLDLASAIVTETFRYYSPVQMIFRMTTCDTKLGGQAIREGTLVCIGIASSGRDETGMPDADTFDPHRRSERRHLGMGLGTHYCVGASLALLETDIALRTVARHFESLRALADVYDPTTAAITRVPRRVEVELTPAAVPVAHAG